MEDKHFSKHKDEHVEFLPVEWRSKLTLDGGLFILFIVIRYVLYIPLDIIKGTKRCGLSVFYMFIL